MSSTPKYSGETNWYVTADLPLAPSANAGRPPSTPSQPGHEAATDATNGSRFTASRMVRAPLFVQDADIDDTGRAETGIDRGCGPRAAQEDGSADEEQHRCRSPAATTSALRARPGRASRATSPRMARTSSRRVA